MIASLTDLADASLLEPAGNEADALVSPQHRVERAGGAAVYIEGLHLCMAARGSESHEARVVTSAVRGLFREQQATRQEFLDLVTAPPTTLI